MLHHITSYYIILLLQYYILPDRATHVTPLDLCDAPHAMARKFRGSSKETLAGSKPQGLLEAHRLDTIQGGQMGNLDFRTFY